MSRYYRRSYKEDSKYFDELTKYRVKCSCGHSILMTNQKKKKICQWCGHYVYMDEKERQRDEFKKKVRGMLNER